MRIAVDIGGTFTDVVVEHDGGFTVAKAPSTPRDPVVGLMDGLAAAADRLGVSRSDLLADAQAFSHATTRGVNAVLTRTTARTALLTTMGHPDILLFREGGRIGVFNHDEPYPDPYVPRSLTYEIPERVAADGSVVVPLDEDRVEEVAHELQAAGVAAAAVCLLWSIVNPQHEQAVGTILMRAAPEIAVTLSHELNPIIREYWRASSAAMDASLKPVMSEYLARLERTLRDAGFHGAVHIVSSTGGLIDPDRARRAPIHTLRSGPAMAPYAARDLLSSGDGRSWPAAIVTDIGGTSLDISVIRGDVIPRAMETWLGPRFSGHLTGFPSVDVRSVGAGGGSIAAVDAHGLLSVGPDSAGAEPGPACYGRGGERPTVTDASLILGYLDPDAFLDGAMALDVQAARRAVGRFVAEPIGVGVEEAAEMVVRLATDVMARAIEEVTLDHGVDPRSAVLVGGGGAAGLTIVEVGRHLGCPSVFVPTVAAALSGVGALRAPLISEYVAAAFASTSAFPYETVNRALTGLTTRCAEFIAASGFAAADATIELTADARYAHQVWEIETPVDADSFDSPADVAAFRDRFDLVHEEQRGVTDETSPVEIVAWRAKVMLPTHANARSHPENGRQAGGDGERPTPTVLRTARFHGVGAVEATVYDVGAFKTVGTVAGPAIVALPGTTLVMPPGCVAKPVHEGILVGIDHGREANTR